MDLRVSDMLEMQAALLEKNKDRWSPNEPAYGRDALLWMMEEIGEICSIIKKRGERDIMEDVDVRATFVEELADVSMYFHDLMRCFRVTAEEFSEAYFDKHRKNMARDFEREHEM